MEKITDLVLKGIIFDHDGTLVDSERYHYQIWAKLLEKFSIDFKEEDYIERHSGMPSKENARCIIEEHDLNTTPEALAAEKELLSQDFFSQHRTQLVPHAETCIQLCLDSALAVGVATGASRELINRSLGHRDFFPHLKAIATGSDVTRNKPAPDTYLLALEGLGLTANQVIAVEDSAPGVASAKAAGLYCIAVNTPYGQDLSQADLIVDGLDQVHLWIEKQLF